MFFQHENRFRYKFFDIVQFSRSCKRLSQAADSLIILPQKWFFVKLYFFEVFRFLPNLEHLEGLSHSCRTFLRLLVLFASLLAEARKSFFCLSAWRSSIIPHPCQDVNTFLLLFSSFFALTEISFILLYFSGRGFSSVIMYYIRGKV